MGLPVICTDHENQKQLVKMGIFVDMKKSGAVTEVLKSENRKLLSEFELKGLDVVAENYDLNLLRFQYIDRYYQMIKEPTSLVKYSASLMLKHRINGAFNWLLKIQMII